MEGNAASMLHCMINMTTEMQNQTELLALKYKRREKLNDDVEADLEKKDIKEIGEELKYLRKSFNLNQIYIGSYR